MELYYDAASAAALPTLRSAADDSDFVVLYDESETRPEGAEYLIFKTKSMYKLLNAC